MLDKIDYGRRGIAGAVKDVENVTLFMIYRVFLALQTVCGSVSSA